MCEGVNGIGTVSDNGGGELSPLNQTGAQCVKVLALGLFQVTVVGS